MSRFRLPMVASLTIALAAAGGVAATCSRSWAEDGASGAAPAAPATPSRAQLRVKEIAQAAAAYDGRLLSSSLAGGPHSLNRLIIRSKGVEVRGYPMVTVEWDDPEADKSTAWGTPK